MAIIQKNVRGSYSLILACRYIQACRQYFHLPGIRKIKPTLLLSCCWLNTWPHHLPRLKLLFLRKEFVTRNFNMRPILAPVSAWNPLKHSIWHNNLLNIFAHDQKLSEPIIYLLTNITKISFRSVSVFLINIFFIFLSETTLTAKYKQSHFYIKFFFQTM